MYLHTIGISRNNHGWTPIHLAAKYGHVSTLEYLLEHSPKLDACEILDNDHVSLLSCTT